MSWLSFGSMVKRWRALPEFGPAPGGARTIRLRELDGVRGWAALSVVLYHVFWEMLAVRAPEFRDPITGFLCDGGLAVSIFFVLSGEALSSPYFAGKGMRAIRALAIKRYSRLAIPVFAACLIIYVLLECGLTFNAPAGGVMGRADWLGVWLNFPVDLKYLLEYCFGTVFLVSRPPRDIDPFLWTMAVELRGSIVVFMMLFVVDRLSDPRLFIACGFLAMAALPFEPTDNLSCFLAGLLFADFRGHGGFKALQASRFQPALWALLGAVIVADGLQHWSGDQTYKNWTAVLFLFAVFSLEPASAFFANPLSRFLGRLSFPIYLVQFPVIVSLSSAAIVWAADHHALTKPVCYAISFGSVVACVLAARLFEPVETLTKYVGNALVAIVERLFGRNAEQALSARSAR